MKRWCMKCRTRHLTTTPHDPPKVVNKGHQWEDRDGHTICRKCGEDAASTSSDFGCKK